MIEPLYILSTVFLGVFAGSLLTEAIILVPYWRKMEANDFFRLHASLGPSLFRYFAPLTSLTVLLAVVAASISKTNNAAWLISAGLSLTTLVIYFVYFRSANNRFATHSLSSNELNDELRRWSAWHWLRTVLILIALGISVYGHTL